MVNSFKIAFVILHYQNVDVTIESIGYLLELHGIEKNEIIIIDFFFWFYESSIIRFV